MNNPKLIPAPFAINGQKNPIPDRFSSGMASNTATWDQGFPPITTLPATAGGMPPIGQDFNGILNQISENIVYLTEGGRYKFSEEHAAFIGGYKLGAILQSDDELKEYQSLIDDNFINFNTATPDEIAPAWIELISRTDDLDGRYLQSANALSELNSPDLSTEARANLGLSEVAFLDEILHRRGNLYEIFIAGAGAQADSRKNLGLKTAATYDVGTGSGQIPDMSSQQKGIGAGFGWQKLPSGLILQWGGTPTIAGSGSSVNVGFPIEFPNAVTGVVFQSVSEVSPSCSLFMHSDVTTSSMKVWGVAKVIAAGATTTPLSAGISASWLVWGY